MFKIEKQVTWVAVAPSLGYLTTFKLRVNSHASCVDAHSLIGIVHLMIN